MTCFLCHHYPNPIPVHWKQRIRKSGQVARKRDREAALGAELTAKNQHSSGLSHTESAPRALYDWDVGDTIHPHELQQKT